MIKTISTPNDLNKIKPMLSDNYSFDGEILKLNGDEYKVEPRFRRFIPEKEQEKTELKYVIEGKSQVENIVGIDKDGTNIILYYADNKSEAVSYKPRFLSQKKGNSSQLLKGNQPLKYLNVYENVDEWKEALNYAKYLAKSKIFAVYDYIEEYMMFNGVTMFKNMTLEQASVLSFDIEAAGLSYDSNSRVFVITNTLRKNGKITKKQFRVDHYDNDDVQMIDAWCEWVVEQDPQIITGHNIFGYDLAYLRHCYGGELPLGKQHKYTETSDRTRKYRVDGNTEWEYHPTTIAGRSVIDGMFLAVKFDIGRDFPSWGLKPIAEHFGFVKEGRQFYDASKISQNWDDLKEREKIVAYCVDDSDDSLALFDKMVPAFFYLSQYISIPLQTMVCGASGKWINSLLVRGYIQDGESIPLPDERDIKVYGGISFGIPGIHKNVFKIDVASLYPSIIRSFNIYDENKDPKMYYKKITDYFTEMRLKNKAKYAETKDVYYDSIQAAQKVAINSIYGMCGTRGLSFNNFEMADKITGIARQIIRKTIIWATSEDIDQTWEEYEADKDYKYNGVLDE